MQDNELNRIKDTIKSLGDAFNQGQKYVQMDDFASALKVLKSSLNFLKDRIESIDQRLTSQFENILNSNTSKDPEIQESIKEMSDKFDEHKKLIEDTVSKLKELEAKVKDEPEEDESVVTLKKRADQLEFSISGVDSQSKTVKESLDNIKEDFNQTVEDLKKEIAFLKESIILTRTNSAGGGVRRVFQPYVDDFSSETDGVNKTFYLSREPLKTNVVTVFGTDFPTILRPGIDFTVTGKVLTLTNQVPAPSSGATLICTFFA